MGATARGKALIRPLGEEVFNPLDKTHLAESVKDHLLKRPFVKLPPPRFLGAGIYAIYYTGDFPPYRRNKLDFRLTRYRKFQTETVPTT